MQLVSTPKFSLAAEAGSPLFAELGKALADCDERYYEVPDVDGGQLILIIDATGLRAVWVGSGEAAPPIFHLGESGHEVQLAWRSGSEQRIHRTQQLVSWREGRMTLSYGTVPRRTLAVEL